MYDHNITYQFQCLDAKEYTHTWIKELNIIKMIWIFKYQGFQDILWLCMRLKLTCIYFNLCNKCINTIYSMFKTDV